MIRISPTNLVATATLTASSEDAAYPVTNLATAGKIQQPWKTTSEAEHWVVIDHGVGLLPLDSFNGTGFTNWTTANPSDEAHITRTITTPGSGFAGSVQRRDVTAAIGGAISEYCFCPGPGGGQGPTFEPGHRYAIRFRYRASAAFSVLDNGILLRTVPTNTGTAQVIEIFYSKTNYTDSDFLRLIITASQWVELDELRVTEAILDVAAVIHTNVGFVTVQSNPTDTWGAPTYTSGLLSITRGPNGRWQHAHRPPTPRLERFTRLLFGFANTPSGVTEIGGAWVGQLLTPPRDLLYEGLSVRPNHPRLIEAPPHGGWEQESNMGPSWLSLVGQRLAHQDSSYAYAEWQAWLDVERQWYDNGEGLICLNQLPSHAWVMKMTSDPEWDLSLYSRATLEARELV